MNDLRKKLSLLSVPALFLLSALLLACGNTEEPYASTDSESEKPVSDTAPAEETISPAQQYLDSLSDVDFGGATISILSMDEVSASGLTSLSAEEENGDILNDTVYQRNRAAEERCNMTIACTEVQNVSAMTKKLVTAGSGEYDLTFNQVKQTLANASHGYYLNFCEIPSIDLSRPWWDSEAAKLLTLNGKLFAAFSDMNIHAVDRIAGLQYFNTELVSRYDLESPYDLVLSGKWTMDRFYEMEKAVTADTNGDGVMDKNDQYGAIVGIGSYNTWINAGGQPLIRFDDNGELILTYATETSLAVSEKIHKAVNDPALTVYLNDNAWGYDVFYNGQALFIEGALHRFTELRSYDLQFGVVPGPKFDEAQTNYYCLMNNDSLALSILTTVSDAERAGIAAEVMGAYSYETLHHAYYEVTLKEKLTRDEYSAKMLDIIIASRCIDYGVMYEDAWGSIITNFLNSIHKSGASELASQYAKDEEKFKKTVEKIESAYRELE